MGEEVTRFSFTLDLDVQDLLSVKSYNRNA